MTAREVAEALGHGVEAAGWSAERCPLADGGEGTAAVLVDALGGEMLTAAVAGPLGHRIEAEWALLGEGDEAVVEVAAASGISLLPKDALDPVRASTYGTGQLIAAAARATRRVLVAVGGSATTDGGAGAIRAIEAEGGIGSAEIVCLCDVRTPWEEAPRTFGPQKGATPDDVNTLEERLERLARELPRDPRGVEHSGAAGGLAGGLWAAFGAALAPGASYVCDAVGVDGRLAAADLAIGGEGRLDGTTLEGKVLWELALRARAAGKPLAAVVGKDASDAGLREELGLGAVAEARGPAEIRAAACELLEQLET
jgi:glycerate 2-kinase